MCPETWEGSSKHLLTKADDILLHDCVSVFRAVMMKMTSNHQVPVKN
jgi:hypothetical protein